MMKLKLTSFWFPLSCTIGINKVTKKKQKHTKRTIQKEPKQKNQKKKLT